MAHPLTAGNWRTRSVGLADLSGIGALHAEVFGPGRFARTAYRVREGAPLFSPYCRLAEHDGGLLAAVAFTRIDIGGRGNALLLGPLAVKGSHVNRGLGRTLVAEGLAQAGRDGMQLVVLVGDRGYYARMGFAPVAGGQICFPGPVDPARILARELAEGALGDFAGLISAAR